MLGQFPFYLSFNADKLRAKLEWLYEVVLKCVGAYLIHFVETIRNKRGRVLKCMEETYSVFL